MHDEVVVGDQVARGTKAVAVERRADHLPSVKVTAAGPSQGSINEQWYS